MIMRGPVAALMKEINDLHQLVEAREGQPAESLDCIEWELQNLSLGTLATNFHNANTY